MKGPKKNYRDDLLRQIERLGYLTEETVDIVDYMIRHNVTALVAIFELKEDGVLV